MGRFMRRTARIFISAIESSGDLHAARFVAEARARRPELEFEGFGGPRLREAGATILEDLISVASMGVGFVRHLRRFFGAIRRFNRLLEERQYDAVVLVDSPGFHFLLARLAKWAGVPVVDYICPQIWAWAPWRRRRILRYTDALLVILPFEEELYRNPTVPVRYVGHPLGDSLQSVTPEAGAELRRRLRILPDARVVTVLPGSRPREIADLMPMFRSILESMALDPERHRVLVSAHKPEFKGVVEEALFGCAVPHEVLAEDALTLAAASDLVLVKSGTVTLEVAYLEKPMVVIYWATRLERLVYNSLSVTPFFALPNILGASLAGGAPTVYERLCRGREGPEVAAVARQLLDPGPTREEAVRRLQALKASVLAPGGVARAVEAFLELLDSWSL